MAEFDSFGAKMKIGLKILFAAGYWLLWTAFFELARLFFVLYNIGYSSPASSGELPKSFLYGLRMDVSVASYVFVPVGIFLLLSCYVPFFRKQGVYKTYTAVILLPLLLIIVCDLPAFAAWGYRLDASPLRYLKTPGEAWASVSHLPVFWFLVGFVFVFFSVRKLFNFFINKNAAAFQKPGQPIAEFLFSLLLIALQIIPIRGGFQLAPLNHSSVYFSKDNFANLCAINAPWNFIHSISFGLQDKTNPFAYLTNQEAATIADSLLLERGNEINLLRSQSEKPNIIVITWESLTYKALGLEKKGVPILPGLEKLKKEGVFFSNVYASGDRTDKGIVAVLSGYPAQPTTTIVKVPEKACKLEILPGKYQKAGYQTSFYYGGEIEFANMKAYLLGAGFTNIIDKNAFASKDQNSKWGAHDHIVCNRLKQDMATFRKPFFTTWLTLSSHEPFETGQPPVIEGPDAESKFVNSLHYSDSVIASFIEYCKMQPWWNNTVVVIIADHGHRIPSTGRKIDDFHIPMLWLGGRLANQGVTINKIISQTDLAAMLCRQTGIPEDFPWSRNMLKDAANEWAYFCFNNGFGFIEPGKYFIYDNVGRRIIEQKGFSGDADLRKGFSIQQRSFDDYLKR